MWIGESKKQVEVEVPLPYTAFQDTSSLVRKFIKEIPQYENEQYHFLQYPEDQEHISVVLNDGIVKKYARGPRGWEIVLIYMKSAYNKELKKSL